MYSQKQILDTSLINESNFNLIIENTTVNGNQSFKKSVNDNLISRLFSKKEIHNYTCINSDTFLKESDEDFDIVPFIQFYNNNYKKKWLFSLLKRNESLVVVKHRYRKTLGWRYIPFENDSSFTAKEINKIECSFKFLLEKTKEKINTELDEKKSRKEFISKLPLLDSNVRNAYKELAQICLNDSTFTSLAPVLKTLKDYSLDTLDLNAHYSVLNYLIQYQYEIDIDFFLAMDWKSDIENLEWYITKALKQNFNDSIDIPKYTNFDENASVSWDGVFDSYFKALQKEGYYLGNINTKGDEYVLLIHKMEDTEKVKSLVNIIGYSYHSLKDY